MAERDGNGWTRCSQGHKHWGRYGAAGLLAYAADEAGQTWVLLQRRSWWGHHGGSWGPPGGARDSHESEVAAALREAAEECAVPVGAVTIGGTLVEDHGGWAYQTLIGAAARRFPVRAVSAETSEVGWVAATDAGSLPLHPGFAARWPVLSEALQPLTIIVDAANVIGSRPDGWWRDRAGAALRLRDDLAGLATAGVAALPVEMRVPALDRWFPKIVLVVEGAARSIAAAHSRGTVGGTSSHGGARGTSSHGGNRGASRASGADGNGQLRVVAAAHSGDDAIADLAGELAGRRLVVTADRQLRARCAAAGASVAGPRWLLGLL